MKKILLFLFLSHTIKISAQLIFSTPSITCKNDTLNLVANSGTISITSFSWATNPSGVIFSAPSSPSTNANFTGPGTYTIYLTAISGTNTYSFQSQVIVNPSPTITLTQSTFTTCIIYNPNYSNPIVLSASGAQSYTWTPTPVPIGSNPNGPIMTIRPLSTSCFTVVGSNSYGCKASAIACATVFQSYSISVTPSFTVMCAAILGAYSSVTLATQTAPNTNAVAPFKCEWSFTSSTNSIQPVIPNWVGPQTYTVEMIDSRGCRSLPASFTITTTDCTSLNELSSSNVKLYPNPTNRKIYVETDSNFILELITLNNSLGQTVFIIYKPENKQEIDISNLPRGIYILRVENKLRQSVFKVVKE